MEILRRKYPSATARIDRHRIRPVVQNGALMWDEEIANGCSDAE